MTNFETVLKEQGVLIYTNKGVSMMPLLRQDKDIMVIKSQNSGFQKNDAVLFKRPNGQYILHRITKLNKDGSYQIIGDNCPKNSAETVRDEQILGILTEVRRDGKTIKVTDKNYLRYVRSVPFRRAISAVKTAYFKYLHPILLKVYHATIKRPKDRD